MAEQTPELAATYEDLIALEHEFDDAELEVLRTQHALTAPLYRKREALISKIEHFWPLVFEQAPPELDQAIQPSDSKVLAESLKSLDIERFEINEPSGSPRSFKVIFKFSENAYFSDEVLEKKFWFRRASNGWTGLVSEPVKINWKKGKDLTDGVTDAAVKLWEARQKKGDKKDKDLPEFKTLVRKLENSTEGAQSFFTWFSFVSSGPHVTAEESAAANAKEAEIRAKRKAGEKVDEDMKDDEEEDDETYELLKAEPFPGGDELAELLADDVWPNAIKYFTSSHEVDDEELSELDVDESDSDEEVDIRALVGKGTKKTNGSPGAPPAKKRKT